MHIFPDAFQPYFVMAVIAALLVAMVREKMPVDVLALAGAALFLATGVLTTVDALTLFSNSAPVTIMALFVVGAALERTGCLVWIERAVRFVAGRSIARAQAAVTVLVAPLSGFMNNTPLVVMMAPALIRFGKVTGIAPSYLLIPLSYAAVLGGTITIIGTSTNILVNGVLEGKGLDPFSFFSITGIGAAVMAVGCVYLVLVGRWLLPAREGAQPSFLSPDSERVFIASLLVPHGSALIGKTLAETNIAHAERKILDVIRADYSQRWKLDKLTLAQGDVIVLETTLGDILSLKENGDIVFRESDAIKGGAQGLNPIAANERVLLEGVVAPGSRFVGARVVDLRLRRLYGAYVVAVRHAGETVSAPLGDVRLCAGDTLLIEGHRHGLENLASDGDLIALTLPQEKAFRFARAPLALGALAAVIAVSATGVMPIAGVALCAAIFVVLAGCLDVDEMYRGIDWRILGMIVGMLGIGMAFEKSGADIILVRDTMNALAGLDPMLVLAGVYLLSMVITEVLTNNAVAVLATPLVIELASNMGLRHEPFVVAVIFAASHAYATPIGYQTNTFVYNLGGYRFADFLRIGLPLNFIVMAVALALIPVFFPFR